MRSSRNCGVIIAKHVASLDDWDMRSSRNSNSNNNIGSRSLDDWDMSSMFAHDAATYLCCITPESKT